METLTSQMKREILASKTSNLRSLNLEKAFEYDLNLFFKRLKKNVLQELQEYWPNEGDVLLQGQLDLILAPIFESQQEYYNILRKYNIKEYNQGCKQARRLVKRTKKQVSSLKSETKTLKPTDILGADFEKDELFATNDWTEQRLLNNSFTASENTINRVDKDINKLLSEGYASGDGINVVSGNIEKRFNQLESWESRRIARTEIHNAHQMGMMNTYQEMGVQYIQWSSAHDNRTRDSHLELDGEIIPLGGTFSNGCQFPGDTKGPLKEWINCRCGTLPFIMPDGYVAPPGMSQFREEDLIQTMDYWNQDELMAQINQERVSSFEKTNLNGIEGYDKYALTESENIRYEELKASLEKNGGLKFHDRHEFKDLADRKEFNELRNKILLEGGDPTDYFAIPGGEGVRYEKLYNQFKNWVPLGKVEIKPIKINKKTLFKNKEAFKITSEEKKAYKRMNKNRHALSSAERKYYRELDDKLEINKLHNKLLKGGLDSGDSKRYVELYSKHKKEWNLPELSYDLKFTTNQKQYKLTDYYKNAKEFKLTKQEADELYNLEKKELYGGKLTSKELKRKNLLQSQDKFAYLNAVNTTEHGLDYEEYLEFKKLYKPLKTKLKLDKSILKQPLSKYNPSIKFDENPKHFKNFKGTTDNGSLPNGEKIEDYFTKDAREMTGREQQVADRWLGPDYKAFTNFEIDCDRDAKKFEKWIYEKAAAYEKDNSLLYYEYYYRKIKDPLTGELSKDFARNLSKSIEYDVPVLDDILNNQLKQGITVWRVQEEHNLSSTVVGDVVEFPNFRSTAISKEGALWFSKTNAKEMKYLFKIELPTGTRCAYLAPIKQGEIINPTSPYYGEKYANEMELLLKKSNVEIIKYGGKPVKGAMGENLTPITVRVVGYK